MRNVLGLVLLLAAGPSAAAQYICSVTYFPNSSFAAGGTAGGISVVATAGPNCSGGGNTQQYVCSNNANYPKCANSGAYSEAGLLAVLTNLREAMYEGKKIQAYTQQCNDGSFGCWGPVTSYGN